MTEAGEYLLAHVGFSKNESPVLVLQQGKTATSLMPLGHSLTLRFDTSQRFCAGWYDLRTGEDHSCPDKAEVPEKYDQCPACQKRTGFNPAFYHAASVSEQQEERNQQPHFLYLAHFGEGVVKVGISYAGRGNSRLLEQGARSALILDTFPTAHIARQYEAKIAGLPIVAETIQLRKKIIELEKPYDTTAAVKELAETQRFIEEQLQTTFARNEPLVLDALYFPTETPPLTNMFDCSSQALISGKTVGMLGSLLFCLQQDTPLFLPLKKLVGYNVNLTYEETPISLPARQTSLF